MEEKLRRISCREQTRATALRAGYLALATGLSTDYLATQPNTQP